MSFLTDHQIAQLAESGLNNYEVSCCWNAASREIRENCEEWFGFTPRNTLVLLALKTAKLGWSEITIHTKNIIEAKG